MYDYGTANKRTNLEAQIFADVSTLKRYVRRKIFIQIVNILERHFQSQRFESTTLQYVIISQTVIDRTNIDIAN